ncbi:hypothetical protein CcaverHIS002_0508300 [Cutaneotrichosporon cavernicola]|nr:hypothetical protein CcaverHIS002_0508300 [Cutaneotrichosporon cavernicola]
MSLRSVIATASRAAGRRAFTASAARRSDNLMMHRDSAHNNAGNPLLVHAREPEGDREGGRKVPAAVQEGGGDASA